MDERAPTSFHGGGAGWRQIAILAALVLGAGCIFTPVPEPPNLEPPDVDRIVVNTSRQVGTYEIAGGDGAATPSTILWTINLDTEDPPVTTEVADDGSFSLLVAADPGDELRLQSRRDEVRSEPVDAVVTDTGALRRSVVQGCIALEPTFEVDLGTAATDETIHGAVELTNNCAEEIEVVAARLRVETAPFDVATTTPLGIAIGESAVIETLFSPVAIGVHEEVLLLEVGATTIDRRAVTLFGECVDR
jgi:hypothetical protein